MDGLNTTWLGRGVHQCSMPARASARRRMKLKNAWPQHAPENGLGRGGT